MFLHRVLLLFAVLFLLSPGSYGYGNSLRTKFFLNSANKYKYCFGSSVRKNHVIISEFKLSEAIGSTTTIQVTDDFKDVTLYMRENFTETKGKFAFVCVDECIYDICFFSHNLPNQESAERKVDLEMNERDETIFYDDMDYDIKLEKLIDKKLKPIEVELRLLKDRYASIVKLHEAKLRRLEVDDSMANNYGNNMGERKEKMQGTDKTKMLENETIDLYRERFFAFMIFAPLFISVGIMCILFIQIIYSIIKPIFSCFLFVLLQLRLFYLRRKNQDQSFGFENITTEQSKNQHAK